MIQITVLFSFLVTGFSHTVFANSGPQYQIAHDVEKIFSANSLSKDDQKEIQQFLNYLKANPHPRSFDDGSWWKNLVKEVPPTGGEALLSLVVLKFLRDSIFLEGAQVPWYHEDQKFHIPQTRALFDRIDAIHILLGRNLTVEPKAEILMKLIDSPDRDFFLPTEVDPSITTATPGRVRLYALKSLGEYPEVISKSKTLARALVGRYVFKGDKEFQIAALETWRKVYSAICRPEFIKDDCDLSLKILLDEVKLAGIRVEHSSYRSALDGVFSAAGKTDCETLLFP